MTGPCGAVPARGRYPVAVLRLRVTLLVVIAGLLAACGTGTPSSAATTAPVTESPRASEPPGATAEPTGAPTESEPPVESATPGETELPAETEPVVESEAPGATPSAAATQAADGECSGNAGNQEFFAGFARVTDWPVLCGVLPKGWFVSQGTYRQANGGKLLIGYKGPAGATIALTEGAFCADETGCVPSGTEIGEAALGPLDGTISTLDDGGYAIVAARGENPSWLFVTHGLDEATTRAFAQALAVVPG